MFGRRRGPRPGSIYSFLITWLFLSIFFPMYRLGSLLLALGAGLAVAYFFGLAAGKRSGKCSSYCFFHDNLRLRISIPYHSE